LLLTISLFIARFCEDFFVVVDWFLGVSAFIFLLLLLADISLLSIGSLLLLPAHHKNFKEQTFKKTKVRKITSLKTSPKVGKITSLNTSPKETNLVKKYCEVGKNHLDKKDKSQGN
jgi:hypothetical protein